MSDKYPFPLWPVIVLVVCFVSGSVVAALIECVAPYEPSRAAFLEQHP